MSCDFGVWFPHKRLSNQEGAKLYACLCEGDVSGVRAHPAIDAFYDELVAKHPEIDTVPDDRIGDTDYCPWSIALDRSFGHVIMPCVWSKADYVGRFLHALADKHGLAVYDPQSDRITYPKPNSEDKRPWWHFR